MHDSSLGVIYHMMFLLLTRNADFLRLLYVSSRPEREALIVNSTTDEIRALSLIASKILQGEITPSHTDQTRLRRCNHVLRALASTTISLQRKRRTLIAFHSVVPILAQQVLAVMHET